MYYSRRKRKGRKIAQVQQGEGWNFKLQVQQLGQGSGTDKRSVEVEEEERSVRLKRGVRAKQSQANTLQGVCCPLIIRFR